MAVPGLTPKARESVKSKIEPTPLAGKPRTKAVPHTKVNPVWHSLATYVAKRQSMGDQGEPFPIQAKLTVSAPDNEYEKEADQVADQVLAAPGYTTVSGTLPRIQRFAGQPTGQMEAVPPSVDQAIAGPGRPLEPVLRHDMEQRFGHDFSQVRIHSDAAAERSAREVNANAYTVGHNVIFANGEFSPGTHEGRRLIAHELTHVVQQSGASGIRLGQSNEKCCQSLIQPEHGMLNRQFQTGPGNVIQLSPSGTQVSPSGGYSLLSEVWCLQDRPNSIVVVKTPSGPQPFYTRSGWGGQHPGGAQKGDWAPFDGFMAGDFDKARYNVGIKETDPLFRYGTEENQRISQWLAGQNLPKGTTKSWREIQLELERLGVDVKVRLSQGQVPSAVAAEPQSTAPKPTSKTSVTKPPSAARSEPASVAESRTVSAETTLASGENPTVSAETTPVSEEKAPSFSFGAKTNIGSMVVPLVGYAGVLLAGVYLGKVQDDAQKASFDREMKTLESKLKEFFKNPVIKDHIQRMRRRYPGAKAYAYITIRGWTMHLFWPKPFGPFLYLQYPIYLDMAERPTKILKYEPEFVAGSQYKLTTDISFSVPLEIVEMPEGEIRKRYESSGIEHK